MTATPTLMASRRNETGREQFGVQLNKAFEHIEQLLADVKSIRERKQALLEITQFADRVRLSHDTSIDDNDEGAEEAIMPRTVHAGILAAEGEIWSIDEGLPQISIRDPRESYRRRRAAAERINERIRTGQPLMGSDFKDVVVSQPVTDQVVDAIRYSLARESFYELFVEPMAPELRELAG